MGRSTSHIAAFDGGGRFQCELTDVRPEDVQIGDRVEMTFRRLYTGAGVHNYFWKARPLVRASLGKGLDQASADGSSGAKRSTVLPSGSSTVA